MGELCGLMPVIHPYSSGTQGSAHSAGYYIADPEKACVKSAKLQLGMLYLLLKDDAKRAKEIIAEFKPLFNSKEEYFAYIDALFSEGDRITYNEDDTATVRL